MLLLFFPIHPFKWLLNFQQGFPSPPVLYIELCDPLCSISISSIRFLLAVHLKPYLTERGTSTAFKEIGIGWEKNLMQIHCLTVLALPCCPCGPSTNAINNKLFFWLKDVLLPKHKLSACYIFWMFGNLVIGFGNFKFCDEFHSLLSFTPTNPGLKLLFVMKDDG